MDTVDIIFMMMMIIIISLIIIIIIMVIISEDRDQVFQDILSILSNWGREFRKGDDTVGNPSSSSLFWIRVVWVYPLIASIQ